MENNREEGGWKEILLNWRGEMGEMMKEIRGIKDWKEDIRAMKEEVMEGIRQQDKMLRDEVEKVRRELREQEERWMKEREELRRVQELEKSMEGREENRLERAVERGGEVGRGKGIGEVESRINEMERKMEKREREREERRKNVVIKGVEIKEGKRREAVEELMKIIGVKVDIGEVKRIGGEVGKGGESLWVKLGSEEQRGRRERIMKDWTWKERKMRWRLEEIARLEEGKGRKVWVGYGKIKIDEVWWKWDEEEEVLKNWGNYKNKRRGRGKRRRLRDEIEKRDGRVGGREKMGGVEDSVLECSGFRK